MHHHTQASMCFAAAAIFAATMFGVAKSPALVDAVVPTDNRQPATDIPPAPAKQAEPAECPAYAQALVDSDSHRVLVVCTQDGCGPCVRLIKALTKANVPFAEVHYQRHPKTFASLHVSLTPTWFVFRNRAHVTTGYNYADPEQIKAELEKP